MRGSRCMAVAVRAPDQTIVVHEEPLASPLYNGIWSRIPFIRGLGLLWDSLGLGFRALTFSANIQAGEDAATVVSPASSGALVIALLFALGLFFVFPLLIADAIRYTLMALASTNAAMTWVTSSLVRNLVEGIVRTGLVLGYLWVIGRLSEIQRVFAYHGAEHKTINAFEAGAALTPKDVARFPLEHPRCGTGFLLVVVVISIVVFAFIGDPPVVLRYLLRILLVPVVAIVAYEYIRFMARHMANPIIRILIAPQLALQRLTTREPSEDMLEVSIRALKLVLASESIPVSSSGFTLEAEPVGGEEL